jgi:hypothetical protein
VKECMAKLLLRHWANLSDDTDWLQCGCHQKFRTREDWADHMAEVLADPGAHVPVAAGLYCATLGT